MYCPNCGSKYELNAKFCGNCGMVKDYISEPTPYQQYNLNNSYQLPIHKKTIPLWIPIASIAGVFLLIFALLIIFNIGPFGSNFETLDTDPKPVLAEVEPEPEPEPETTLPPIVVPEPETKPEPPVARVNVIDLNPSTSYEQLYENADEM